MSSSRSRRTAADRSPPRSPPPTTSARAPRRGGCDVWRDARERLCRPTPSTRGFSARTAAGRRCSARLGPDAADPIDEFLALALAHEQSEAPSLTRFLAEVEADRRGDQARHGGESDGVRVLTVHASKGLEAPIVFLPDTCGAPDGRHDPKLMRLAPHWPDDPPLFAWSRKAAEDCEAVAAARGRAARGGGGRAPAAPLCRDDPRGGAPHRRRLRDVEGPSATAAGTISSRSASGASMTDAPALWDERGDDPAFRRGPSRRRRRRNAAAAPPRRPSPRGSRPRPRRKRPVFGCRPRAARPHAAKATRRRSRAARARAAADSARRRAGARAAAAAAYLDAHGGASRGRGASGARGSGRRARSRRRSSPPCSVPARAARFRSPACCGDRAARDLPYSGRLDRMLVTEAGGVLIVDFKLGAAPCRPSPAHVAQLALYRAALRPLYPTLPVRAALVYLDGPTLRPIETDGSTPRLTHCDAS